MKFLTNKKKYGQFFTDTEIATFMTKWVMENNPKNLLDPAVGKGVFLKIAKCINKNIDITAFDIDKEMCIEAQRISDKFLIKNENYLFSKNKMYDAIICNPPYNKFQEIKQRKELIGNFEKQYNIKLNGYSNLCIYFLIKSLQELNINGRCCYIIPYEFLNTGYGKIIKKYFIKTQIVHSIIKFDNSLKLFPDAITTSCIILIENKKHEEIKFINISKKNELDFINNMPLTNMYKYTKLDINEKWINYFNNYNIKNKYINLIPLKLYAQAKRGIATGNNAYFTLNNEKILDLKLSKNTCVPCITKAADITTPILNDAQLEKLKNSNKKIYLFNGTLAINEYDYKYIKYGENCGYHKTYLTSHRKPWFLIENKEPAPILLSVFCRNKIKVIRNVSKIKNLTTFHGLHFNKNISEDFINIFFCYLLTPIAQQVLFLNKREYGKGLDKFEPNDLNDAFILNLEILKKEDKQKILKIYNTIYDTIKTEKLEKIIYILNDIFKKYLIAI